MTKCGRCTWTGDSSVQSPSRRSYGGTRFSGEDAIPRGITVPSVPPFPDASVLTGRAAGTTIGNKGSASCLRSYFVTHRLPHRYQCPWDVNFTQSLSAFDNDRCVSSAPLYRLSSVLDRTHPTRRPQMTLIQPQRVLQVKAATGTGLDAHPGGRNLLCLLQIRSLDLRLTNARSWSAAAPSQRKGKHEDHQHMCHPPLPPISAALTTTPVAAGSWHSWNTARWAALRCVVCVCSPCAAQVLLQGKPCHIFPPDGHIPPSVRGDTQRGMTRPPSAGAVKPCHRAASDSPGSLRQCDCTTRVISRSGAGACFLCLRLLCTCLYR
ncbi:hypothetical protein OH76DRAFT_509433 [Lentinus brumalis]|uniref:Uncharacterized protein n=1 Tax=Lentinus brumalis TaxID=2498619 RepID=A0A371DB22_9APHY|nr:hypothetical protein OH76DRAFT_509433 [Polyporus brumalis]